MDSIFLRHLLEWSTVEDVLAFGSTSKAHREIARSQPVWEFLAARDLAPLRLSPAEGRALYEQVVDNAGAGGQQVADALFAAGQRGGHQLINPPSAPRYCGPKDSTSFLSLSQGLLESEARMLTSSKKIVPDCWTRGPLWKTTNRVTEFVVLPSTWRETGTAYPWEHSVCVLSPSICRAKAEYIGERFTSRWFNAIVTTEGQLAARVARERWRRAYGLLLVALIPLYAWLALALLCLKLAAGYGHLESWQPVLESVPFLAAMLPLLAPLGLGHVLVSAASVVARRRCRSLSLDWHPWAKIRHPVLLLLQDANTLPEVVIFGGLSLLPCLALDGHIAESSAWWWVLGAMAVFLYGFVRVYMDKPEDAPQPETSQEFLFGLLHILGCLSTPLLVAIKRLYAPGLWWHWCLLPLYLAAVVVAWVVCSLACPCSSAGARRVTEPHAPTLPQQALQSQLPPPRQYRSWDCDCCNVQRLTCSERLAVLIGFLSSFFALIVLAVLLTADVPSSFALAALLACLLPGCAVAASQLKQHLRQDSQHDGIYDLHLIGYPSLWSDTGLTFNEFRQLRNRRIQLENQFTAWKERRRLQSSAALAAQDADTRARRAQQHADSRAAAKRAVVRAKTLADKQKKQAAAAATAAL